MTKKVMLLAVAVLMFAALVPSLTAQTYLLDEDFEGSFPPTDWTRINHFPFGSYYNWYRRNDGSNYRHDTYSAGVYYGYDYSYYSSSWYSDEWLITPVIDLSGYSSGVVTLGFNAATYYYYYTYPSGSHSRSDFHPTVRVSTDGGSSWDPPLVDLWQDYPGVIYIDDAPNPFLFDLSAYIGEQIQIGFNAYAYPRRTYYYAYAYRYFYVDDVWVTYEAGGELDLEMVQIIRPNSVEEGGVPFTPACKVNNKYIETVTALVRCRIKEVDGGIVYEDDLNSFPFEPGYNDVEAFKDFTPEGGKRYNALFVVEHPDDINPGNNDKDKNFNTELGIDVTPFELVSPASDTQINAFSPSARYAEGAGVPTDADLIYTVEELALHAIVESDTVPHSFAGNDTFTVTFGEIGLEDGKIYLITFWAEHEDEDISNPRLTWTFSYVGVAETPFAESTSLKVVGTTVNYTLAKATDVTLRVYDVTGNLVATLASGTHNAGSHSVSWNTAGVASGVYFVKMLTPEFSASDKMVVLY